MAAVPPILGNLQPQQADSRPQPKPGQTVVAKEVENDPQGKQRPNYNNEDLDDVLQRVIWDLIVDLEGGDQWPRRTEIKGVLQRRLFWRGDQYRWWSETQGLWYPAWENPPGTDTNREDEDLPAFLHVTNIFQAFGLSWITVLTQNSIGAQFWPKDVQNAQDVETAKRADKVCEHIHRDNNLEQLKEDAAYFLYTDGFIGGYVRYVSDGEKFGYDKVPKFKGSKLAIIKPARQQCSDPQCMHEEPEDNDTQGICPSCGSGMDLYPPEQTEVPESVDMVDVPRGAVQYEVVGALHLKRSMWANRQEDFLYLHWITDLDIATGKSLYPHVADQIDASTGTTETGSDTYERLARRILYDASGANFRTTGNVFANLGVYRRCWIRPRAFNRIGDEDHRKKLQKKFPNGLYCAFYGMQYCESRNESMDDKWVTMHANPGEGQVRNALGSPLITVQEMYNDLANLQFETAMFVVPEGFAEQGALDFEARRKQTALPGNISPVTLDPNADIRQKITFGMGAEPSSAIAQYMGTLFSQVPQFLSGVFPALFGGDTAGNDTASGIAIQRDQAMGRIGRVWRKAQYFYCKMDELGVRNFARNAPGPVTVPNHTDSDDYEGEEIDPEDLQGNIRAFPESDQQYPVLESQQRALVLDFFKNLNPLFMQLQQLPENLSETFRLIGLKDYEMPDSDSQMKQAKENEQLLAEMPVTQIGPDGKPVQVPSVSPQQFDNHQIEAGYGKRWLNSPAGQKARKANPQGVKNVELHTDAHDQMAKMQALKEALATQAAQGKGPAADLGGAGAMGAGPPKAAPPPGGNQ